jgi:hypothetical protein
MRKPIRIDYVLVCEDIRAEIGNKPSAMGIFTDDVAVLKFPIQFPKFCFLIHGSVLSKARQLRFTATLKYTELAPLVLAKDAELRLSGKPGGFVLNLVVSPLLLPAAGEGELELDFGTTRYSRKFQVQQATQEQLFGRVLSPLSHQPTRQ